MIFEISEPLCKNDISLHVLNKKHVDALVAISRDVRIWKFGTHDFSDESIFREKWIQKAFFEMENNKRICFVIFLGNKIIGSSSYYHIDPDNKNLSIGYTWFHPDYWGSSVNPLSKLIMLDYAFDTLDMIRVEFCVDSINLPSQNSLSKFGIQKEGVLRNHMILSSKRIRDSVIFSVIPQEWLVIKSNIERFI